jgi:hypothetical protein
MVGFKGGGAKDGIDGELDEWLSGRIVDISPAGEGSTGLIYGLVVRTWWLPVVRHMDAVVDGHTSPVSRLDGPGWMIWMGKSSHGNMRRFLL